MSKQITRIICMILTLAMVAAFALVPMASAAATKTIYFDNSTKNWDKVNVYTWTDGSGEYTGSWPGTAMTKVSGNTYSLEVPTSAVNIIFNNGDGAQTANLVVPTDAKNLYNGSVWGIYGEEIEPVELEYCLVGWINGADHGCNDDYENVGDYVFVNGTLTATFETDSYIFVKSTDNSRWLLSEAFCTSASCDFVEGGTEKMFVPGNQRLTFTLVENADGSVNVTYTKASGECAHVYKDTVVAPTCENNGYTIHKCTLCGYQYNDSPVNPIGHDYLKNVIAPNCTQEGYTIYSCLNCGDTYNWNTVPAVGHSYVNGTCTVCGETDSSYAPVEQDYYLFGYINGADYGWRDDINNIGVYKFVDGKLTVRFDEASYVAVKTGDNAHFYMTNGYVGEASSATLVEFADPDSVAANRLYVPGGAPVTFTLSVNSNGNLVLSYTMPPSACSHATHGTDGVCPVCGTSVSHVYANGACSICGSIDESYNPYTYYLYGYINGADYATDSATLGEYKFVDGKLTVSFSTDSYVGVKEVYPNGKYGPEVIGWYVTDGWLGTDVTTATLYRSGDVASGDKLFVPGGVELTFTMSKEGYTIVLSYTTGCAHSYTEEVTTAPGCLSAGVNTFTCTKCGSSYTASIPATGHNYVSGKCTGCGITDPSVSGAAYCLVGYINGANYGCEEDHANIGQYVFVNGKLTTRFESDSYIFVKSTDNTKWYLTGAYTEDTTATFYQGGTEKMFVPGGVTLTFTLTENEDGSVVVSYTKGSSAASAVPTLTLKAPTLEFKDMICVVAFYTAENNQDVVEMGMLTYSTKPAAANIATAEHVTPGATYEESSGRYFSSSHGIHAKYLGDTVYLAIYAKLADGTYAYSKVAGYSAVQYATNQLKGTDTKLKQLVAAMLNYGAEAQLYFGHNTSALANASLTAEQKALPAAYSSSMGSSVPSVAASKQGAFANNSGFSSRRPAISFEGAFCINYFFAPNYTPDNGITLYYWSAADFNKVSVLNTSNATGSIKMTGSGTGDYRADITGISAKALSEAVYVAAVYTNGGTTWTSGVLGYSIGAYCSSQASKGGDVADLAKATAVYGYHAKAYFG